MAGKNYTERVEFKLIKTPCCGHLLCWVNPRYPTYCPECGEMIYRKVTQFVLVYDPDATLQYHQEGGISGVGSTNH